MKFIHHGSLYSDKLQVRQNEELQFLHIFRIILLVIPHWILLQKQIWRLYYWDKITKNMLVRLLQFLELLVICFIPKRNSKQIYFFTDFWNGSLFQDPELCVSLAFSLQYVRLCVLCWLLAIVHHMYKQFNIHINTLIPRPEISISRTFLGWVFLLIVDKVYIFII